MVICLLVYIRMEKQKPVKFIGWSGKCSMELYQMEWSSTIAMAILKIIGWKTLDASRRRRIAIIKLQDKGLLRQLKDVQKNQNGMKK